MPRSRRSRRTSMDCTEAPMKLLARALVALTAVLPLACSAADKDKFEMGRDFTTVRTPQQTADPSKIEVMEVFAYSCPHCFHLEGEVDKWLKKKPADVNF